MDDEHQAKCQAKRQRKEEKRRRKEEKKLGNKKEEYYMTYGVGYKLEQYPALKFKTASLANKNLVGDKYELVFYASQKDNIDKETVQDAECICRTARGGLELSVKEWDGKPALFGKFTMDTRTTNGTLDENHSWGNYPSCSFVELVVTDCNPGEFLNGFNMVKNSASRDTSNDEPGDLGTSLGRKAFVLDREPYDECCWWKDLHTQWQEDFYEEDRHCGAILKIVAQRRALALDPTDKLQYNHYGKQVAWSTTGQGYTYESDNEEWAEKAMKQHQDGNNPWMCQHLHVPAEVAFKIREFVMPPPVFYVEQGDLVLVVEESKEIEWIKTCIFRKVQ